MVNVSDEELGRIRSLDLRDEVVRDAAAGYVWRHLQHQYGLEVTGPMVAEGLAGFVRALEDPALLEMARDLQARLLRQ